MVRRPSRRVKKHWEAHLEGSEGSGGPHQRVWRGWQALLNGRDRREGWERSGVLLQGPGVVRILSQRAGRPFWRAGMVERVRRGVEVLLKGREGSGSPFERPGDVGRPSRRSVKGQESLLGGPGGVWRPFLWDSRGREAFSESREG